MNKTIDGFVIKTKRKYPAQELFELMQGNLIEKFGTMFIADDYYAIGGQTISIQGVDGFEINVQPGGKIIVIKQEKLTKVWGEGSTAGIVVGTAIEIFARDTIIGSVKHTVDDIGSVVDGISSRVDVFSKILKLDGSKGNWALMEELAKDIEKLVEVKTGGCYIATCIYGSYNCPEVWTLRRYRDARLSASFFGRQFIRIYYTVSPKIVEFFGTKKWFKGFWKPVLDRFIRKLQQGGIDSSPYLD